MKLPLTSRGRARIRLLLLWAAAVSFAVGAVITACTPTIERTIRDRTGLPVRSPSPTTTTTAPPATTTTAPSRSGFMVFGDFGGGDAQYAVAGAMARWAAGHRADALVTTGDNVYTRGEPWHFEAQLDAPYRELRRTRPLWVTLGNHDVVAGYGDEQLAYLKLPPLPYERALPGLQLLFLDGNRPNREQGQWLEARLAAPGPAVRVVVLHQPAYSCSVHGPTQAVVDAWVPIFEKYRVDLVLAGHDHNYQRFVSPSGVNYIVTGGGGRPLYGLTEPCTLAARRVASARRHHFVAVEVVGRTVTVTAVASDDAIIDRFGFAG